MKTIRFSKDVAQPIDLYSSSGAASISLASGSGESHVHAVYLSPRGMIGPHPADFDQLFLVVRGSGWVSGPKGRVALQAGEGACIRKGEVHSKGSETGMMAIMLQASAYTLPVDD